MNKQITLLNYLFADLVSDALKFLILHYLQTWRQAFGVGLLNEWRFADGTSNK